MVTPIFKNQNHKRHETRMIQLHSVHFAIRILSKEFLSEPINVKVRMIFLQTFHQQLRTWAWQLGDYAYMLLTCKKSVRLRLFKYATCPSLKYEQSHASAGMLSLYVVYLHHRQKYPRSIYYSTTLFRHVSSRNGQLSNMGQNFNITKYVAALVFRANHV